MPINTSNHHNSYFDIYTSLLCEFSIHSSNRVAYENYFMIDMKFLIRKCFCKEENASNLRIRRGYIKKSYARRPFEKYIKPSGHWTVFLFLTLQHWIWLVTSLLQLLSCWGMEESLCWESFNALLPYLKFLEVTTLKDWNEWVVRSLLRTKSYDEAMELQACKNISPVFPFHLAYNSC